MSNDKDDLGLDILLELSDEMFPMENGYWTKIEAKTVVANEHIPHGVRYSLTLHNPNNVRILGYDNANGIKPKRKNMVLKELFGIIDMKEKLSSLTSLRMQVNC